MAVHGHDVTKGAIIDVNSIVSGQNYDILTSIIAKLLMSRPFGDLSRSFILILYKVSVSISDSKGLGLRQLGLGLGMLSLSLGWAGLGLGLAGLDYITAFVLVYAGHNLTGIVSFGLHLRCNLCHTSQ